MKFRIKKIEFENKKTKQSLTTYIPEVKKDFLGSWGRIVLYQHEQLNKKFTIYYSDVNSGQSNYDGAKKILDMYRDWLLMTSKVTIYPIK